MSRPFCVGLVGFKWDEMQRSVEEKYEEDEDEQDEYEEQDE